MAKAKASDSSGHAPRRPALSLENREQQLAGYAHDLAEKQLLDGTASSQVITYYLKLGSSTARLEKEKLERENELLRAKVESLQASARSEELFEKAIAAMRRYSGHGGDEEDVY